MKKKKNDDNIVRKSFISSIIFLVIVIVVFYFIFKENNYKEVSQILKNSNYLYLLFAVLCMSCFSIGEALNLKTALAVLGDKVSFKNAYKYALSGFFVASITPSSTGGDPMQLYLMAKDNIKVSHGIIVLLLKLLAYEFVLMVIAIFGFINCHSIFLSSLGNLKYLAFLGMFLNFLVGTLYFLLVFFKPVVLFIVEIIARLLDKVHYKNTNKVKENLLKQVDEFSKASMYLKQNKKIFVKMFLITLIQMLLYHSIPYFVYLSLGFSDYSPITFISIQSLLFASVSSLPFPGAVGVSEATFMKIYKTMFPKNVLGSAMVITRFVNFYIFVLYAGVMMVFYILKDNFKE